MSAKPAETKRKARNRSTVMPLPSLIRASGLDASNSSMRKAGRTKWNNDDWNAGCEVQERLIHSIYGRPGDHNQPNRCYIRFSCAEKLERAGHFHMNSDLDEVMTWIDEAVLPEQVQS